MTEKKKKKKKKLSKRKSPTGSGRVTRERLRAKAPILKKLIFQSRFIPTDIDEPTRKEDALKSIKEHSAIEKILFFGDEVPAVSEEQIYDFCYDCVSQGKEEVLERIKNVRSKPTTYKPWIHIPMVLNRMSRGCSQIELALEIGVMPYMINRWKNIYPSFNEACAEGFKLSEAWWLKVGRSNLANSKFNNNLYANQMAVRFGHTAKLRVDHSGKVDHNVSGSVSHNHRHTIATLRDKIQELPIDKVEQLADLLDLDISEDTMTLPEDFREVDFEAEAEDALEEITDLEKVRPDWSSDDEPNEE